MLHIVTGNTKKFEKILSVIHSWIELKQVDLDVPEIQSLSVIDVSQDKAKKAFAILQKPLMVEDTWVYFDWYNQFPWPLAKQAFEWLWVSWMNALFDAIENKKISFKSVVSYIDASLDQPISFVWESTWIADFSHPNAPFNSKLPYLSFFRPEWKTSVASMLDDDFWKDTHHRVKAVRKFNERFKQEIEK